MALTQNRIHQTEVLLAANGSVIGGADGVTLDVDLDTENITPAVKDLWPHLAFLTKRWGIGIGRIQYLESAAEILGQTGALTFDGVTVNGWQTSTLSATIANVEVTDIDDAGTAAYIPGVRSDISLVVRGNYYDHEATLGAGHKEIYVNQEAKTKHTLVFTFGAAQSFSVTAGVRNYRIIPGSGNVAAQFEATFMADGVLTNVNTNVNTGLGVLLDACFASTPAAITALLHHSAGNTQYTGSTLPSRISTTVAVNGSVSAACDLIGNGAITDSVET